MSRPNIPRRDWCSKRTCVSQLAVTCALVALSIRPTAQSLNFEFRAKVISVVDGDTITVLTSDQHQHKIRLNGIDAPEVGQDFSEAAKTHLSTLVFGQDVLVFATKSDPYARLI